MRPQRNHGETTLAPSHHPKTKGKLVLRFVPRSSIPYDVANTHAPADPAQPLTLAAAAKRARRAARPRP